MPMAITLLQLLYIDNITTNCACPYFGDSHILHTLIWITLHYFEFLQFLLNTVSAVLYLIAQLGLVPVVDGKRVCGNS